MDISLIPMEVTPDIALKIRVLAETGVFAAKGGSVEIHFDNEGSISQIVMHTYHKIKSLQQKQHEVSM